MLEVEYPIIAGQTLTQTTQLPEYVLYLFNLGMFIGFFAVFISLIWAGVLYFLSPIKADLLGEAKDRVGGAISGLLILSLTYLILTTINPQLKFLNFNKLPEAPPPPEQTKSSGVYFFKESECSNENTQANASSVADLGTDLKNQIKAVGIVQDAPNQNFYVPILYDATNFQGMCQYLNTNQTCQTVSPLWASASILKYDPNPNGDGVYFYRKSYFNDQGGSYKVGNSEIGGAYPYAFVKRLEDLKFQGVPQKEQDCTLYDKNGVCVESSRRLPDLSGENISSIKIKGNYVVLFVYLAPQETSAGPWTYCQAFPTVDDVNKTGPQQIKWENIRNHDSYVPNYVVIIPVKQ